MIPPHPTTESSTSLPGRVVRLHFTCRAELPIGSHLRVTTRAAMGDGSVAMVTTPDTYPLWTTRHPVIVVVHRQHKAVQRHYYRYCVVTPTTTSTTTAEVEGHFVQLSEGGVPVVLEWELRQHGATSNTSSSGSTTTGDAYANLPYRTLDISVASASVVERVQDNWNQLEDATFQPFLIRDAVRTCVRVLESAVGWRDPSFVDLFWC